MTGRFPYGILAKYPHMKPEDIKVWERFIAQRPDHFDRVDYDVAVGAGAPTDPTHPPEIQADHTILTQKKVDVVAYKDGKTYVIEVGPIADMRKLGQALAYSHLYANDHPDELPLTRMVIAGEMERELEQVYATNGVEVELAPLLKENSANPPA